MDHLPYPAKAMLPPLEIPYICQDHLLNNQHGSELVTQAPSFARFSKDYKAATKYWEECDSEYVAGEAQAIIYFGLLRDILGRLFVLEDFVHLSSYSKERVVTLATFEAKVRAISTTIPMYTFKGLALMAVYFAGLIRGRSNMANRIAMSIDILAWSMATIIDPYCNFDPGSWRDGNHGLLEDRLLAVGWCPYWIKIFSDTHSTPVIHYLTGMVVEPHSGREPCSTSECSGHNVDMEEGKYVSKHTGSACKCAFKGPDTKAMHSIIRRGGVPLVKLSETSQGDIEVDLVELGYGKPFVAISHVWAGGLGNPQANTIPNCQLKFIYRAAKKCRKKEYGKGIFRMAHETDVTWKQTKYYKAIERVLGEDVPSDQGTLEWYLDLIDKSALLGANESSNDLYLWFDTFCIPIAKKEGGKKMSEEAAIAEELNKIAINRMAFVYAAAMHVLVIESTVRDVSYRQTGDLELATLLLTSPWMSRCWTFQEACLARQFSFVLDDELLEPRGWNSNNPTDRSGSILERVLKDQCLRYISAMPDVMNQSVETRRGDQLETFIAVWNALSSRSTTKRDDLHGLLAIMLNMSALEILRMTQDKRMLAIMRAQEKVPLSLLFFPYPETAPLTQGCEWLPRYPSGSLSAHLGYMTWALGEEGLEFVPSETQSVLLMMELNLASNESQFLIKIPESNSDVVQVDFLPSKGMSLSTYQAETLCILLHGYHRRALSSAFKGVGACFLLKSGKALEQQHLRLKFICPIGYSLWKPDAQVSLATYSMVAKLSDATNVPVEQLQSGAVCVLKSDHIGWPQTKYTRPKAHGLQSSLSKGAFILIGSIWCIVLAAEFSNSESSVWCYSFYQAFEYTLDLFRIPSWLKKINIPMKILRWMFHYPRSSCAGLLIFARLVAFMILEYPSLEYIAQRIRYERYAESFDFIDSSVKPKAQPRFRKEPLYQYQPLWKLCNAFGISALNFAAATWPTARPWLIYLPHSPAIHSRLILVIGKAVMYETVARVAWELTWRWLGMDTSAEKPTKCLKKTKKTEQVASKKSN